VIKLKNLGVELGEFLLEEVNLEVRSGEYFIILGAHWSRQNGPSGNPRRTLSG